MIVLRSWDDSRQQVGHIIGRPKDEDYLGTGRWVTESYLRWRGPWVLLETRDEVLKAFELDWEIWQQQRPTRALNYQRLNNFDSISPKGMGKLYNKA